MINIGEKKPVLGQLLFDRFSLRYYFTLVLILQLALKTLPAENNTNVVLHYFTPNVIPSLVIRMTALGRYKCFSLSSF